METSRPFPFVNFLERSGGKRGDCRAIVKHSMSHSCGGMGESELEVVRGSVLFGKWRGDGLERPGFLGDLDKWMESLDLCG